MWAETSRSWSYRLSLISRGLRMEWTLEGDGNVELFNIQTDPLKTEDIAESKKRVIQRMKQGLDG
jgi:hypothetical protein